MASIAAMLMILATDIDTDSSQETTMGSIAVMIVILIVAIGARRMVRKQ